MLTCIHFQCPGQCKKRELILKPLRDDAMLPRSCPWSSLPPTVYTILVNCLLLFEFIKKPALEVGLLHIHFNNKHVFLSVLQDPLSGYMHSSRLITLFLIFSHFISCNLSRFLNLFYLSWTTSGGVSQWFSDSWSQ